MKSGAPIKLDEVSHNSIVEEVRKGAPFAHAYLLSGINQSTGEKWRTKAGQARSRGEQDAYTMLADAMDMAKAEYLKERRQELEKSGEIPAFWMSNLEILSRRDPVHYSKNALIERSSTAEIKSPSEQIKSLFKDMHTGVVHSEEALRMAEVVQKAVQIEYDSKFESLRESILEISKQMEGKK